MSSPDLGFFAVPTDTLPLPVMKERTDERGNGFGMCLACKKLKRVWAHVCGMCGESCE
jgi:hypothetical protein